MSLVGKDLQGRPGVVSIVGVEWRYACGGALGVVVHEFYQGKQLALVVLVVITVNPQVLFHRLIRLLRLSVRLRVVRRAPVPFHFHQFQQPLGELGYELTTSIRNNVFW